MQKHHWVEGWDSWNREVAISERTSVAHCDSIGRESLEILIILVSELVVFAVHGIGLEANTESVKNRIVVFELHLVRGLLEAQSLLDVHAAFCHSKKIQINY